MKRRGAVRTLGMILLAMVVATPTLAQDSVSAPPPASSSAPPPAPPVDPGSQKARKLIDQMVEALGGQAWLTYTTTSSEGRSYGFYHGKPTTAGTLYRRFYQYPDKERQELPQQREMAWMDSGIGLPVPIPGGKPGDIIIIRNGDKGYEITYKGTEAEDEKLMQEFVRRSRHSLELWIRKWLNAPGTVLFYDGPGVADQQLVELVSILNMENDQITIGIDINSHLPILRRYNWRDQDKYKVEDETIFGNYRREQGIMTPHTLTNKRDGEMSGQSFLKKVTYNQQFPAGYFDATATYDREHYREKK